MNLESQLLLVPGLYTIYIQPPAVEQAEVSGTETPVTETVSGGDTLVDRVSVSTDCQVVVEGKSVYKATVLKEIFSNDKV